VTPVLFALGAALGASGRYALGFMEKSWQSLLIVNTVGSLALGLIFEADLSTDAELVLGVGLCGSLTTFSSFADELHRLGPRWGIAYTALTVLLCSGAIAVAALVI
jgi:CrcB protein